MRTVNNSQDILDSRDVIERRDELTEERCDLEQAIKDAEEAAEDMTDSDAEDGATPAEDLRKAKAALLEWDEENAVELAALEAFISQGSSSWEDGETLIRESYFETYAQELAEDIGALEGLDRWPATCIDWEHAARELRYDYIGADFDGVTYYYHV